MDRVELSPRVFFAKKPDGEVQAKVILPPALEGLPEADHQAAIDEFYIHLMDVGEMLKLGNPVASVHEILANSPQEALKMWPEVAYDLRRTAS